LTESTGLTQQVVEMIERREGERGRERKRGEERDSILNVCG
jgi:hypothetical protein